MATKITVRFIEMTSSFLQCGTILYSDHSKPFFCSTWKMEHTVNPEASHHRLGEEDSGVNEVSCIHGKSWLDPSLRTEC